MAPLRAAKPPWNVNACAQAAGQAALGDADHYRQTVAMLREQKTVLTGGLTALGWQVLPSAAAFFLVYAGNAPQIQTGLAGTRVPGARLHVIRLARAYSPQSPAARAEPATPRGIHHATDRGRDRMNVPRLIIGGTRSGEGKTTIALGLMAALRQRGMRVQGFKVGPDYLDTGYQLLATGQVGRNLDLWMMGEAAVCASLQQHGSAAEIAVIEGVMGLYDGHRDGLTPTSTADVAKVTNTPVILVIDADCLAASAGAIALGYRLFDPEVQVAGVILNRWNPSRSKTAVELAMARAGVPVLGYLPSMPEVTLPSRHLGLVMADEMRDEVGTVLHTLGERLAAYVDIDRLLTLAQAAGALPEMQQRRHAGMGTGVRIAVARDEAFAFYYPENMELLETAGAEVVYFSPLTDPSLPAVDGLYLGGGYPELHAERLAANITMRASIATAIRAGMPTYAECGGLLYLCETLTDIDRHTWPMVGAVPTQGIMHARLQRMGYHEGVLREDCLLGPAGTALRGHEFHYSSCSCDAAHAAYTLDGTAEGYVQGNLLASYLHLHFAGCPQVAEHWLAQCRQYQLSRMQGVEQS